MRSTRTRWWQRMAVAIAALAVGAATVIAAAPAASAADGDPTSGPTITLDKSTGLDPDGDTIHVTGAGFTATQNATTPPLSGHPAGFYVAFGKFADTWKPSDGAGSASRPTGPGGSGLWWVVPQVSYDYIESVYGPGGSSANEGLFSQYVVLQPDGSFDLNLTVAETVAGKFTPESVGNYGVYTYQTGGGLNAAIETYTPITFDDDNSTPPPPTPPATAHPAVSVSPTTLDPAVANTLRVTGSGFTGDSAANGVYVLFGAQSVWSGGGPLPAGGWIKEAWVQPGQLDDGRFSTSFVIPANTLSLGVTYQVVTSAAHELSETDRSLDTFTTVTTAAGDDTSTSANAATVEIAGVEKSGSVTHGKQLTFTAGGFAPGEQVTATVHSDPIVIGTKAADANGRVTFSWTVPAGFAAGVHRIVLNAPSGAREAVFTVVAAATAVPSTTTRASASTTVLPSATVQCTTETVPATAATSRLTWGVDSSFVSYVEGGIAKGAISVAGGAARVGQQFTWGTGAGSLNGSGAGTLRFPGSVHFTGHDGVLNLTVSNVRVAVTGPKSGTLIADIASTDMSGKDVSGKGVVLATLAFSSLSGGGGKATATLTGAGAAAFAGFYEAGRTLAPVTIAVVAGTPASTVERCVNAAGDPVNGDGTAVRGLASTGVDVPSLAGVAALLTLLGAALIAAARRRQVTAAHR